MTSPTIPPYDNTYNTNTSVNFKSLAQSLRPVLERIRRDVTAARKHGSPAYWTRESLTLDRLNAHLAGTLLRGVSFIPAGGSTTKSAVLDLDDHDGSLTWDDTARTAVLIMDELLQDGLVATPIRSSGGKGIHLWLLWEDEQDAYSVRECLTRALERCWLAPGTGGLAKEEVEIFPKQDRVPLEGYGSMVILPLGGNTASCPLMRQGSELHPMPTDYPLTFTFSEDVPVLSAPERPTQVLTDEVMPLPEIESLLAAIDNDGEGLSYDRWRDIVFAVHHETGGSAEGLELVQVWSARSDKHDPEFLENNVWPYVKSSRGQVITGGTLRMLALKGGWSPPAELEFEPLPPLTTQELLGKVLHHGFDNNQAKPEVVAAEHPDPQPSQDLVALGPQVQADALSIEREWLDEIHACTDAGDLRKVIAEGIRNDRRLETADGELTREILANAWADRLKDLGGRKISIKHARSALTPKRRRAKTGEVDCPEWMEGWLYVQQEDVMFHEHKKTALSTKAFNLTFAHEVRHIQIPGRAEAGEITPVHLATALVNVDKVARVLYMPKCADRFSINGIEYVNSYDPKTLPETPDALDQEGQEAVDTVLGHLEWLIADERERQMLLDWMAWQVQRPGEKVRWAPLICGQEGDGKSALGDLLRAVCGLNNVRVISTRQLESAFTGWAHGAAVGLIEEIYIPGHNRYEVVNALKPYITNDQVEIHPKGRDPYNSPNTMNYMAFTNFEDAIPLEEGSRRYYALRTRFRNPADLSAALKADPEHFDTYYRTLEEHGGALRRWLLDHKFGASFEPFKPAPVTAHLRRMISLSVSDEALALEDVIESGTADYVGSMVLSTQHLSDCVKRRHGLSLRTRTVSRLLLAAGWRSLEEVSDRTDNRVRFEGGRFRIWVNWGAMSNAQKDAFADDCIAFVTAEIEAMKKRELEG